MEIERTPEGLQAAYERWQEKRKMGANKTVKGTCEICDEKRSGLKNGYGHLACQSCRMLMTNVKKRPEAVVKYIQEVHGTRYFPAAVPIVPVDELFTIEILGKIRTALGVDDEPLHADLPGIVAVKMAELDTLEAANTDLANQNMELQQEVGSIASDHAALETNYGKMANKMKGLQADVEEQALIIKDMADSRPGPAEPVLPESGTQVAIAQVCGWIEKTLLEKNQAYNALPINPVRIFSCKDPVEQTKMRIDDRLLTLAGGYQGEDVVMDLVGELGLLFVQRILQDAEKETA